MRRRIGLLDIKKTKMRIIARTNAIVVGNTYFLSGFHDKEGAYVEVLEKSIKSNSAGWPSTVKVKMLVAVGKMPGTFYAPGNIATVNATNLYEQREDASHAAKMAR